MRVLRTGGSDAHFAHEVGLCYTEFRHPIADAMELLDALKGKL